MTGNSLILVSITGLFLD